MSSNINTLDFKDKLYYQAMSLIDRMGPASAYNYAKERLEIGKEIENPMMKSEWEKIILFIEKEFEA